MADHVFPQHGDTPDAANFAQMLGRASDSDYVESGINITNEDYGALTFDLTAGTAFVLLDSMDTAHDDIDPVETRSQVGIVVEIDARSGLSLTDNANNHVFLDANFGTDDSPLIDVNTTGTAPSDESIKIGEIDTSANTSTETSRAPSTSVEDLTFSTIDPSNGLHWDGTTAQITVSDLAGTVGVDDYLRLEAGSVGVVSMGGLFRVQDGPLVIASSSHVEDGSGNTMLQNVVASGQVTLSSGTATVATNLTVTDATFMLALGLDDPGSDAKVAGNLFWDESAGSTGQYKIEIKEQETSVNPTVNYDVIRVR